MEKRYFTIGMAGHIDHGKTALTKALTNVDTDRLKEEKERKISIELGFAPLYDDDRVQISVVDVPGHERFIRQMIAGVVGIDFVVLVIAADEGVMPQTQEHAEILSFLNIKNGLIALTKIDKVDAEMVNLVKEDIRNNLLGTVFENSPIIPVSSLTGQGCELLKTTIVNKLLLHPERPIYDDFRLPIDQIFTIKGQGTIVRGTIYEGMVSEGDRLTILPNQFSVKVRQIQVHHKQVKKAYAGQRAAMNITGIPIDMFKRGDTLVSSRHFITTDTIDVIIKVVKNLKYVLKQRMQIKCNIGTSEVTGKIIFFDRNEVVSEENDIFCQLRLDSPIVAKRGDRFIIRRPSPFETIGGGWIIDPNGKRYKFGNETISFLKQKKDGNVKDRLFSFIREHKGIDQDLILTNLSIPKQELDEAFQHQEWVIYQDHFVTHHTILQELITDISNKLNDFHHHYPLQMGLKKAELVQDLQRKYPTHLIEYGIKIGLESQKWNQKGPLLSTKGFLPHPPQQWKDSVEKMLQALKNDDWKVEGLMMYMDSAGIKSSFVQELTRYLINNGTIIPLNNSIYWHKDIFNHYVSILKNQTRDRFDIQSAKTILNFSRKYLILFLDALDEANLTIRQENDRVWK